MSVIGWLSAAAVCLAMVAPARGKDTNRVFVSNEQSQTITVLDGKDYSPIASVNTGRRPRHMLFNADKTRLYVACGDDNRIDVVDVDALQVVDTIPGIDDPEEFDIGRDDRLYVSNEDAGMLSIIDLGTKQPIRSVKVGQEPEGVIAMPDGKTVLVASEAANLVQVIDVTIGEVTRSIAVGSRPRRFAQRSDGREIWVSAEIDGAVYVLDGSSYAVSRRIEFRPAGFRREDITPVGIALTRDGTTGYVTLGHANRVAVVDAETKNVRDYILVGRRPWGVGLSRDEKRLFVANGGSDDMTIIDAQAGKVIRSVPVGRNPNSIVVDD